MQIKTDRVIFILIMLWLSALIPGISAYDLTGARSLMPGVVLIQPGQFLMGSPESEPCRYTNETLHEVILTRAFYIMVTEVTRQDWADLLTMQPTLPADPTGDPGSEKQPVRKCTWYEAILFANLLSLQNGLTRCYYLDSEMTIPADAGNYLNGSIYCNFPADGFRLPTESEWEYACRAGTTIPFSCDEPEIYNTCSYCTPGLLPTLENYCIFCANDTSGPSEVGSKLPNAWNLSDMHGNMREWCWDIFAAYPTDPVTDPTGPASGYSCILRGGYWYALPGDCRSASRFGGSPLTRSGANGFRLVRTYDPQTPTPTPTPQVGLEFIPPGNAILGSATDEPCRDTREMLRDVTLTRGFFMMQTEVTRRMWELVKADQPGLTQDPSDLNRSPTLSHPLQNVTWYQALLFANLLSIQQGFEVCYYLDVDFLIPIDPDNFNSSPIYCNFNADGFRLPTEAEWEYACRAGTTTPFSCDEPYYADDTCGLCYDDSFPVLKQHCVFCKVVFFPCSVVGSKLPNQNNLYDMHGNVFEWCWDWYSGTLPEFAQDPTGPEAGESKVIKGGSWLSRAKSCRSAYRSAASPDDNSNSTGFRLVRTPGFSLDLEMPGKTFGPESPVWLDLHVKNSGPGFTGAKLYLALGIGSQDFWFYPGWLHYPPDLDFMELDIEEFSDTTFEIIPEFTWPAGAGTFNDAAFLAAVIANDSLIGHLCVYPFGWTEQMVPTPTPSPTQVYTATPTPTNTATPTPTLPPAPTETVPIEPGVFLMGSPENEACRGADETQHEVTLSRGLQMMRTEVTRQMWADLRVSHPDLPIDHTDTTFSNTLNHPTQNNTWYEVVLFANVLSLENGYTECYYIDELLSVPVDPTNYLVSDVFCDFDADGYRLPTEAEWEYACRAGTMTAFSCPETAYDASNCHSCQNGVHPVLQAHCTYCTNDYDRIEPVGSKLVNDFALFDMHGNLSEWCWDWYDENYPTNPTRDPTGPLTGDLRIIRGGGWQSRADKCRSACRIGVPADYRDVTIGVRLVRTAAM